MDISGVDVDCLSDEEILELCGDIVDCGNDEIFILDKTNVNELTDSKTEELYDEVLYGENNNLPANNIKLTDKQVMDLNYNIIDMDQEEILLLNGQNINIQNLSDEEMMSLYDDIISSDEKVLISDTLNKSYGTCYITYVYIAEKLDSTYGDVYKIAYTQTILACPDENANEVIKFPLDTNNYYAVSSGATGKTITSTYLNNYFLPNNVAQYCTAIRTVNISGSPTCTIYCTSPSERTLYGRYCEVGVK